MNPRKYAIVRLEQNRQDGWTVEIRLRQSGKLVGSEYKVFKSPTGTTYYSKAKAVKDGFKEDKVGEVVDLSNGSADPPKRQARGKKVAKK